MDTRWTGNFRKYFMLAVFAVEATPWKHYCENQLLLHTLHECSSFHENLIRKSFRYYNEFVHREYF